MIKIAIWCTLFGVPLFLYGIYAAFANDGKPQVMYFGLALIVVPWMLVGLDFLWVYLTSYFFQGGS